MNLQINFPPQNSIENQAIMNDNIDHIKGQCLDVLALLLKGERLTVATTAYTYGIGDLRARIRDLIHAGVPVQKEVLKGRYKRYFLEASDINRLRGLINSQPVDNSLPHW